jgi:hypothetical protein
MFIDDSWVVALLNRASNSFTYPLLGPLFFRTSSYEQSWPSLEHVPQLGLLPSHLSYNSTQSA